MIQNNLFVDLRGILGSFLKSGKIEPEVSEKEIKKLDGMLKKQQYSILCEHIPDEEQNVLFNALRNVRMTINEMDEQLKIAFLKKENPVTAERCISLMPFIDNLNRNISEFKRNVDGSVIVDISRNIRILRKKARQYNLHVPIEKELREVNISKDEIRTFLEELNDNIVLEMEQQ